MSEGAIDVPTREGYDRWAALYDGDANPLVVLEGPEVERLLGPVGGLTVLDLGCGTGRHALRMAAEGAAVHAVDFSEAMLARARVKPGAGGVAFRAHDLGTPLPYPAGSFDRVVCGLVVDHIRDLKSLFAEMRRVLRPGGAAVVSVLHPAMALRGVQARFRDPESGAVVRPAACNHQMSDHVLAAARAGLALDHLGEHVVGEALAARVERVRPYLGWPMLFVMRLVAAGGA